MRLNYGVGDFSESLGLQGDQTIQSLRKSTPNTHWRDWCWSWNSCSLATWYEELTHWKRPRCWERLKAGEGDGRGWAGWMASLTQWTWVWVGSKSWWWTGKLGVLQSMGLERVGHELVTSKKDSKRKICLLSHRYYSLNTSKSLLIFQCSVVSTLSCRGTWVPFCYSQMLRMASTVSYINLQTLQWGQNCQCMRLLKKLERLIGLVAGIYFVLDNM